MQKVSLMFRALSLLFTSPVLKMDKVEYVVAIVNRATGCVVAWAVCSEHTPELMQSVMDAAPHVENYYSDAFNTYRELCW